MHDERQLIALVDDCDAGSMTYITQIRRLHQRALATATNGCAAVCSGASEPAGDGPPRGLMAPQTIRLIAGRRKQPLAHLLALSAHDEVDALLVPESAGRGVACQLARRAACSVWFVPNRANPQFDRILVPVDFSARAADSIRVATSLASFSGGECQALHVWFNDALFTHVSQAETVERRAIRDFDRFIARIDCWNVSVSPIFEESTNVAQSILRSAEQHSSDLIVLASRGRSRPAHILRPSLVERVIQHSRVPVLVVKHFGARLNLWAAIESHPERSPQFN